MDKREVYDLVNDAKVRITYVELVKKLEARVEQAKRRDASALRKHQVADKAWIRKWRARAKRVASFTDAQIRKEGERSVYVKFPPRPSCPVSEAAQAARILYYWKIAAERQPKGTSITINRTHALWNYLFPERAGRGESLCK